MKINRTIEILEALASGCSPQTGEIIQNDSVLNERDVIRALEKAISELERIDNSVQNKTENTTQTSKIHISETEANIAIKLFQSVEFNRTISSLETL